MPDAGIYQLLIQVGAPLEMRVGALGQVHFVAGFYVYTGSMRRGLSHRLRRHRAREKPLRWHIDYLTTRAPVVAQAVWPVDGTPDQECRTHQRLAALPSVVEPVPGFGSSDCRCRSHLAYLGLAAEVWRAHLERDGPTHPYLVACAAPVRGSASLLGSAPPDQT